jgi:hypothetical protein
MNNDILDDDTFTAVNKLYNGLREQTINSNKTIQDSVTKFNTKLTELNKEEKANEMAKKLIVEMTNFIYKNNITIPNDGGRRRSSSARKSSAKKRASRRKPRSAKKRASRRYRHRRA